MNGNLLFVGGDLSGIQKFIYNISSKKAMVSLKGRSQYLKDYTEEVCGRILDIPEVKESADVNEMKVYCSGGKFYLQVPDTDVIRSKIDDIRSKAEQELWNKHNGQLAINIGYVPFCNESQNVRVQGADKAENIGALWREVNKVFAKQKNQKFKQTIIDRFGDFFEVQKVGGDVKVCSITGIESSNCKVIDKDEDGDVIWVLDSVKEQIIKGQELKKTERFKTLEQYADKSYLGVLRMDVDGLGKRFIKGFNSMSEYKTFSNRLDKFFTDELRAIQKRPEYSDFLNIVYAGGDDIFVVGRWNKVIDFAATVREEFKKYVNDSTLSISGGVAIVNAKFPIAKAAELAGDAEDNAKHYSTEKNAFCMFGQVVSWKDEFDFVKRYKILMYDLCKDENMPKSMLHKLMIFANMKERGEIKYLWHTAYFFKRFKERYKSKAISDFCKDLQDQLYNKPRAYNLLALSARWAELELR